MASVETEFSRFCYSAFFSGGVLGVYTCVAKRRCISGHSIAFGRGAQYVFNEHRQSVNNQK